MLRSQLLIVLTLAAGGCAAPQIDTSPPPDHPAHAGAAAGQPPLRSRALAEPAPAATPAPAAEMDHSAHDEPAATPTGHERHGGHQ